MTKGAKFYNAIIDEVVRRQVTRAELIDKIILADGYMVGTEPASEADELQELRQLAPQLPEIAQSDPKRAAEIMRRIDKLSKET
jgi:hypothetical protein